MKNRILKILFFIFICLGCNSVTAQELNCNVTVNADKVPGSNKQIFTSLQRAISDFINQYKWSNLQFQNTEKIECNILITINEQSDEKTFKSSLQIQARRPIYNSSYYSTLFNFKDENFNFTYIEMEPLDYVENQFVSNLTSMLAYYAYVIIGYDCDSYANLSGTESFSKAESIVNLAQSQSEKGWKAFEDMRNRYALINNLTDENLRKFREAFYKYHRLGLDEMTASTEKGLIQITQSLSNIREANRLRPSCIAISSFLDAKRDEIVNIYSKAPLKEKKEVYEIMMDLDPSQSEKYEIILKP